MKVHWLAYAVMELEGSTATLYQLEPDLGYCVARQEGIEISRADVTCWLRQEARFYGLKKAIARRCFDNRPPRVIIDPVEDENTIVVTDIHTRNKLVRGV